MDCAVLDARPEHIDAVESIEKQCFSMPWTKQQLIAQLPDDMHVFLVAEGAGKLLGYVGMMYVLDEGYISNVAVASDSRRAGVGDMLICELLRRAKAKELSFVTLEVRESNAAARALYAKHGFVDVGRRKNYYFRPTEDAILMTKFLK